MKLGSRIKGGYATRVAAENHCPLNKFCVIVQRTPNGPFFILADKFVTAGGAHLLLELMQKTFPERRFYIKGPVYKTE